MLHTRIHNHCAQYPSYFNLFVNETVHLKYPATLPSCLQDLIKTYCKSGHIREEGKTAKVLPIIKRGDWNNWDNHRWLSLLNMNYKLCVTILPQWINYITETILLESQHVYRKGRSCLDCTFTVTQLIQKRREFNLSTYRAFADYTKTSNILNGTKFWEIMINKGILQHLIKIIQNI